MTATRMTLRVQGTVHVPGDKSISHRALMLAALARGTSRVRGIASGADVESTAAALRALGAAVPPLGAEIVIHSEGIETLRRSDAALDCGNSGTTARLMAGIAASRPFETRFKGDASLSRRPMARVAAPLRAMGAEVELAPRDGLPMRVRGGALHPVLWRTEQASAQVKSAVLLAALGAQVEATIIEPSRSRDHTERMLQVMGARVVTHGNAVSMIPGALLRPLDITVPGDPSAAAFLCGLAALADHGELVLDRVLLNPTRTGWIDVLRRMGASLEATAEGFESGEPIGTVRAAPSSLRGVEIRPDEVPSLIDELPLIACLGARAAGETHITGAGELRVKESDRIALVVHNLRRIGAPAEELPDGFLVRGTAAPLRGVVQTDGDHRIAMAFGILAALPGNDVTIDEPTCVATSYPEYWSVLKRLSSRSVDGRIGAGRDVG